MKKKKEIKVETDGAHGVTRPTCASQMVPYAMVRPDPDQPRKTFSEASLKEMADSIREQGIVQRLILEHVTPKYKILEPDLHAKDWRVLEATPASDIPWSEVFKAKTEQNCRDYVGEKNLEEFYRIVCGERRWRGAALVGLTELPADVYENLTPQQRFAFQFIENNQRENVSALEEAEAMKRQLEKRKAESGNFSPEDLAKELGISRAGCYERLKLTRLHKPVREALLAGKISTSVAGELAKLPTPQAQEKLLKQVTNENDWQFPFSVRDVQEIIDDEFVKQLGEAPFDQKLTYGNSLDLLQPCTDCPHRTGNMVAEFPDLKSRPNVCTFTDCFAKKCKAFWIQKAEKEKTAGKTVLTTGEFRKVKGDYLAADKEGYLFEKHYAESPRKVLGKHAPEPVLVATPEGLKKFYKKEDVQVAAKKAGVKLSENRSRGEAETPDQKKKREAKERLEKALGERRDAYMTGQFPELGKLLARLKPATALDLAWKLMEGSEGYYDDEFEELIVGKSKSPQVKLLARLFADNSVLPKRHYSHEWQPHGLPFWKELGIDLVAGFEAEEKLAAPALPLAKGEAKQGKLLEVKKSHKKGRK